MGQATSISTPGGETSSASNVQLPQENHTTNSGNNSSNHTSQHIQHLIHYARDNYQENPTESLAALLQAMTLNSGKEAADVAMERLRDELGEDIADHIGTYQDRAERAMAIVEMLLSDENTELFKQGKQDLLRQTMEDGSSVVCRRCNDVVASTRWQQHQQYWCRAANNNDADGNMSDDG